MTATPTSENLLITPKKHYVVLDGLRGIAALTVVWFHIFEAFATSHLDQRFNHGYLAVDFFFLLSGFVVGFAYDDRWNNLKIKDFFKSRIIRLHPMVIMGALIGAFMFYTQGCEYCDVSKITIMGLFIATLLNMFLIPAPVGYEVRGVGEMFPLNGPSWSLFFEYIGNILYALILRRLSTPILTAIVVIAGVGLALYATLGALGDVCVGYSLTQMEFLGGFLRLLFSFAAGLLMIRIFKPAKIKFAFWICGAILVALLITPRVGGAENVWVNGLYDTFCFMVAFPLIVYLGASAVSTGGITTRICKFLGDLSYPLYMVHYPFLYLYFAWVKNNNLTFEESLPGALSLFFGSIILAYVCLKFYDIPVRKYLTKRFLNKKA